MILFKHSFCYTVIFLCGTLCDAQGIGKRISIDPYHYTIQKDVEANNGIVACAHLLAAKVGLGILMQGGNDIDVAIAIQLAPAVVYPGAGNMGGEEFMAATPDNGKKISLDFREVAPAMAKEDMYADNGTGKPGIPGRVFGFRYARNSMDSRITTLSDHRFAYQRNYIR